MKLYYAKGACSLVVRIVLNELGLTFEDEVVDLRTKKTATGADFLAINAKGAVPTLAISAHEVLTENQVICQYLADSQKNQTILAPVGDMKRYHTLEWMNYIATELHKSIGIFFNPTLAEDIKRNFYQPLIMVRFNFIEKQLAKHHYLMGDSFTMPDAYLLVMTFWAKHLNFDMSGLPNLQAFVKRMLERPKVKLSLQQEGL